MQQAQQPPVQQQPAPAPVPPTEQYYAPQQEVPPPQHQGSEFTPEYQDEINDFIGKIVGTDRPTLQERISGGAAAGGIAPPQQTAGGAQQQQPPAQQQQPPPAADVPVHNRRESVLDEEEVQQIKATGKISIYLSLDGADSNKLISVMVSITFDEFLALAEKKFGHQLVMHFKDGEDLIDLDDDDTLGIFFESAQGKRPKVYCKQPPPVVDDAMTTQVVHSDEKPRASVGSEKGEDRDDDGPAKAEISSSATFTYLTVRPRRRLAAVPPSPTRATVVPSTAAALRRTWTDSSPRREISPCDFGTCPTGAARK